MNEVRLALVGFGNVAQGLTQILAESQEEFARQYGLEFLIVAIADPIRGTVLCRDGVPPAALLAAVKNDGVINGLAAQHPDWGIEHPGWDALEMIQNSPADVVVELSYTNLTTGEPATTYIAEALRRKRHVITTNKGPIALHYQTLADLAQIHGVQLGVEGTVMSGTPCLHIGRELLAPARIQKIAGILNGTTNFILTQMETGRSYAEALAEAQAMGYAEADPTGDVEGFDAAAKVAILSQLILGIPLEMKDIERQGITAITPEEIAAARANHSRWKLIGSLEPSDGGVRASVKPVCVPDDHPLAQVGGVTNAICFSTERLGDVTVIGPGAGRMPTGYAIIQDLLAIYGQGIGIKDID